MISSKIQQRKIDMGKTHEDDEIEIDLMELFYALKKRILVILAVMVLGAVAPVLIPSFW